MNDEKNDTTNNLGVVKPVLQPMSDEELIRIISYYPQAGKFCRRIRDGGRPYSATTVFITTTGRYVLKKRTDQWRSDRDIRLRHSIIRHLRSHNFPTPAVLSNRFGDTLTETGGFYYELFEEADGTDLYANYHTWMPFEKGEHAYEAGRMLARLHKALENIDKEGWSALGEAPCTPMRARFDVALHGDLQESIHKRIQCSKTLLSFFEHRDWKQDILPLYESYHRNILSVSDTIVPWISHGDWHANNLFFRGDRITSVIDFHLADLSFRMYDLAVALDRNGIVWPDIVQGNEESVRYDILRLLLEGYRSVLPITEKETALLTPLMAVHQLDLALTNIEYYFGIEKRRDRAEWAYSVYLLDHTRFYRTENGGKLMAFIRNQA